MYNIGVFGVSPLLPDAIEPNFINVVRGIDNTSNHHREHNWLYDLGGLSAGE